MTDVTIRPARAADQAALLDVWERSVRATHTFLAEADIEFYRPLLREALATGELEVWVLASETDVPVGFLGLAGAKVEALFLAPEHRGRGRGAGRQLVAHAQALRGGELLLDVNEQNGAARGFYETLGFVVEGRSPLDGTGRPYPLLHMRRPVPSGVSGEAPAPPRAGVAT
jgi:putative acetyltransferase